MAIKTKDVELDRIFEELMLVFPKKSIHGEILWKKFPEDFKRISCKGVSVIYIVKDYGSCKDCIHFCRESEILRMKINDEHKRIYK